jgi:folate-dependent phosphoribosylglycinamide formyltransferase PurN
MKIAFLTSNSLRHKYVAHVLSECLDLELIISERKSPRITSTEEYSNTDAIFIKDHFSLRENSEQKYFGNFQKFPEGIKFREITHGNINTSEIQNLLQKSGVDYIILFGTSIIGNEILEAFPNRVINFHLGLSPYYKGSATNLFPYYYNEPECIGGTIHLASSKVDQGAILKQFRPEINLSDNLHEIGNKVILEGGKLLPDIILKYDQNKLEITEQGTKGMVFRNKDLTPDKLRSIYLNFEKGMIEQYLRDKNARDKKKPICS